MAIRIFTILVIFILCSPTNALLPSFVLARSANLNLNSYSRASTTTSTPKAAATRLSAAAAASTAPLDKLTSTAPATDRSRVTLRLQGESVSSAAFRSDLKKELTFFRGCAASYQLAASQREAVLTTEGKTAQLLKFFGWLAVLSKPASERKANFQGPSLQVSTVTACWEEGVKGDLVGFTAPEPPPLAPLEGNKDPTGPTIEGGSMAGTDESV